jgi:hypothetical protein
VTLPPAFGGFLLDLIFDPEDGDDMFLRNFRTTLRYNPEDRTLQGNYNFFDQKTIRNVK